MSDTNSAAESHVLTDIVDAVKASLKATQSAFFSSEPRLDETPPEHAGPCIAGIISFVGDVSWSFSWVLTQQTAPVLAKRFAGFDIPFDSSDMGDMTGELVNVIAGEIVAQLERRRIKAQMSLPTIARGSPLELVPENGPGIVQLDYSSPEGPFWFRLAAAKHRAARMPGKL